MSWKEATDEIAKNYYSSSGVRYKNWHEMQLEVEKKSLDPCIIIISRLSEAAKLYAKSKHDEACEAQKELIVQRYYDADEYELEEAIINAPKPEFKH